MCESQSSLQSLIDSDEGQRVLGQVPGIYGSSNTACISYLLVTRFFVDRYSPSNHLPIIELTAVFSNVLSVV